MSGSLLFHRRRGQLANVATAPDPDPPPGGELLGVGSSSNSYTDDPPTAPTTTGNWYVDGANGNNSNSGVSVSNAFATIQQALSVVQDGQTILVRGGTYMQPSGGLDRTRIWTTGIRIMGYGNEVPVLSAQNVSSGYGLHLNGSRREHWCGFHIINAAICGVRIYAASDNRLERIYVSHSATSGYGSGIIVNGPNANRNLVVDCAVWRLGSPGVGGTNTPDAFVFTSAPDTTCSENRMVRCFGANATDDIFDFYRTTDSEGVDLVALAPGYYYNGSTANTEGHGYKMGGGGGARNTLRGSLAVLGRRAGLNSNGAPNVSYINCTTTGNNYGIEFRNGSTGSASECIAVGNNADVPVDQYNSMPPIGNLTRNSWQVGVTNGNVSFAQVADGDYSLATGSPARTAGLGGTPIGASTVALELLKRWWNHSEVWIPGRGYGPGGTGLPGDI